MQNNQRPIFLFGAVCLLPVVCVAQPVITSGHLGSAPVDVTKQAASPIVTLNIAGPASTVTFEYQSPSGSQKFQSFSSGYTGSAGSAPGYTGKTLFQGYTSAAVGFGGPLVLSLYAEPGMWTLTFLSVCGLSNQCTNYYGSNLQALFPRLTFEVSNPNPPDITAPTAQHATIKTPVVSLTNGPSPEITFSASDDVSGVQSLQVIMSNESGEALELSSPLPSKPILKASFNSCGADHTRITGRNIYCDVCQPHRCGREHSLDYRHRDNC